MINEKRCRRSADAGETINTKARAESIAVRQRGNTFSDFRKPNATAVYHRDDEMGAKKSKAYMMLQQYEH